MTDLMQEESPLSDNELIDMALSILKSTQIYKDNYEDADWNVVHAVSMLEAHLQGDNWI